MIHRVDERSQQTKFYILQPYKKKALMPTFYSTLSTMSLVFSIFQCVTSLGGQIISDSDAAVKEVDTINALILGEKKIPKLTTLMCAGNPDCSSEPSLEPIIVSKDYIGFIAPGYKGDSMICWTNRSFVLDL